MNITDDQLRALLAKMLPETISQHACGKYYWIGSANGFVLDTELLALCSLVEAGLTDEIYLKYGHDLMLSSMGENRSEEQQARAFLSATWQQRTTALAEVKGVTL